MNDHVFIIAEAGVNHNGSLEMALQLVDAAAEAGADAIKFQTFRSESVVTADAAKADYQVETTGEGGNQLEMIRKLELAEDDFCKLAERAAERGIEFMSTPFDFQSLHFLVSQTQMQRLKIPSGEITNGPFLLEVARTGLPLIVSTGMCTLDEIETALGVLAFGLIDASSVPSDEAFRDAYASDKGQDALGDKVVLLHCTTEYPAPYDDVNLRAMETMRERFGLPVGYSDHTNGIAVPVAAVALGAPVMEKHFTLDRTLPGPDQKASLEPSELKEMVESIRTVSASLGSPNKKPAPSERGNIVIARRSLVAAREIRKGEVFELSMIDAKRPATGLSPMSAFELVGQKAKRDYRPDEMLEE